MNRSPGRGLWLASASLLLLAVIGIALLAHYTAQSSQTSPPTVTNSARSSAMGLTSPWPGAEHEGSELQEMADYWYQRLTYPTGVLNPEWILQATKQDQQVQSGVPAGRVVYNRAESQSPLDLDPNSFLSLGPKPLQWFIGNTGGRVNAIVVDPVVTTTAYLGVAGGGVWKSTNCCSPSTVWLPVTDVSSVPSIGVDDLTIDPNDHNVIYAGTGDLNYTLPEYIVGGVLKSTDAGASWSALGLDVFNAAYPVPGGAPPETQAIGKVKVDPRDSNKIVAGTKSGLFVSYDGGANWAGPCYTNPYSTQRQDVTGLLMRDTGSFTELYVAQGTRGFSLTIQPSMAENGANGIYKAELGSSGCPAGWSLITRQDNGWPSGTGTGTPGHLGGDKLGRIDLAFAPGTIGPGSSNVTIYAQVQSTQGNVGGQLGVWRTTDGGTTWSQRSSSSALVPCPGSPYGDFPQNWFDQGLAVDPTDLKNVYMDTFDLWRSTDGGVTFTDITCGYSSTAQAHPDHHAITFRPGSTNDLLAGTDGGVYNTSDGGTFWQELNDTLSTLEFYSGDITADFANSDHPAAAGGMQDNGTAVTEWFGTPGPSAWSAVLGGDGIWSRIEPVLGQRYYAEVNGARLFASESGGFGGYNEITGGWRSAPHNYLLPYDLYKYDCPDTGCTHVIVGSNAVSETVTGVAPWIKVSPDFPGYIEKLHYSVSLSTTAIFGTSQGQVVYGFGLGQGVMANWVDVTGGNAVLPNRPILDVATDPVNPLIGYAGVGGFGENTPGHEGHVFRVTCTADCASFAWEDKSGNLPDVPVEAIVANPLYPQQIFVGTDWGLYYSDDITAGVPVWQRFDAGLPHAFIYDMQIDRGFTVLSVWTRSRGAFVWPLPAGPVGGPTVTPGPATATATSSPTVVPTSTEMPTATSTSTSTSMSTSTSTSTVIPSDTPSSTYTVVAGTATPTLCAISFTDVPAGSTFYDYVQCMACKGIINGYTTGCETGNPCFRPNANVTRGQLSKIVSNAAGFHDDPGRQWFEDVPPDSTFFDFIQRLANRGIINGYPCGGPGEPCGSGSLLYFRPNANVTRGQLSKIVSNAVAYSDPPGAQQFEDVLPGSTFYDYIWRLADRGIMSGYQCGGVGEPCGGGSLPYFRPSNNATRGQASKIVANTFFPACSTPDR